METTQKANYPAHLNPFCEEDLNPFGEEVVEENDKPLEIQEDWTVSHQTSSQPIPLPRVSLCKTSSTADFSDKPLEIQPEFTALHQVTQPTPHPRKSFSKSFSTADFKAEEQNLAVEMVESAHVPVHTSKSLSSLSGSSIVPQAGSTSTLRKKRKAPPPPTTDVIQVVTIVEVTSTITEHNNVPIKTGRRLSQIKRPVEVDEKPLLSDTEDE